MKRLLIIFSTIILGFGSTYGVTSCKSRVTHEPEDEIEINTNKDLEILNKIKEEAKTRFDGWWAKKSTININDYPDEEKVFETLLLEAKNKDSGLSLNNEEQVNKFNFLRMLFNAFRVEFDNLNQELQNKYSNYFSNTKPLLLGNNDVQATVYYINYDKITKLIKGTPQEIKGVTVQFNIAYELRFKGLQQRDQVNGIVISYY